MSVPICPNCGGPILRALDLPYGWWEWDDEAERYRLHTAATRVDVSPWVHAECMGELRHFHPQNAVQPVPTA